MEEAPSVQHRIGDTTFPCPTCGGPLVVLFAHSPGRYTPEHIYVCWTEQKMFDYPQADRVVPKVEVDPDQDEILYMTTFMNGVDDRTDSQIASTIGSRSEALFRRFPCLYHEVGDAKFDWLTDCKKAKGDRMLLIMQANEQAKYYRDRLGIDHDAMVKKYKRIGSPIKLGWNGKKRRVIK